MMNNDEIIKAYNEGYNKGCKDEQLKFIESLKVLTDRIKELEEKHWDECMQIAVYSDQLRQMNSAALKGKKRVIV